MGLGDWQRPDLAGFECHVHGLVLRAGGRQGGAEQERDTDYQKDYSSPSVEGAGIGSKEKV